MLSLTFLFWSVLLCTLCCGLKVSKVPPGYFRHFDFIKAVSPEYTHWNLFGVTKMSLCMWTDTSWSLTLFITYTPTYPCLMRGWARYQFHQKYGKSHMVSVIWKIIWRGIKQILRSLIWFFPFTIASEFRSWTLVRAFSSQRNFACRLSWPLCSLFWGSLVTFAYI